jgi:hypothetical protein
MKNRGTGALSKGRLLAFRQCPKRLWLDLRRSRLLEDAGGTRCVAEVAIMSLTRLSGLSTAHWAHYAMARLRQFLAGRVHLKL